MHKKQQKQFSPFVKVLGNSCKGKYWQTGQIKKLQQTEHNTEEEKDSMN
jgi:hypothetical protein